MKAIKPLVLCMVVTVLFFAGAAACARPEQGDENQQQQEQTMVTGQGRLAGKTIYWLGSSVTYGHASGGKSMAEFLSESEGCDSVKEAVSGTTMFTDKFSTMPAAYGSYTQRLTSTAKFKKDEKVDAFICQISTNDAAGSYFSKWGKVTAADVTRPEQFDLYTTAGAMEYIIAYVEQTWDCPVLFYSGAYFGDGVYDGVNGSDYAELIKLAYSVVQKWSGIEGVEVGIIDMFNDEQFNDIPGEDYDRYMSDAVHPTLEGYEKWWTPYFAEYLVEYFI